MTGRIVPEIRIIIQSLYLLIPLSILGIWKLINIIHSSILKNVSYYFFATWIVVIIFALSYSQMIQGVGSIDAFQRNFAEKDYQKNLDDWIINNIPSEDKIASDLPHAVLLKTGHEAVNFAHPYKDNISYEKWIIKKFDIDYLVFYYDIDNNSHELSNLDLGVFHLEKIYDGREGGVIYKVIEKI